MCTPRSPWSSDRKSTRLNSSHQIISYAVFCLKKKKNNSADFTKETNENDKRIATADKILLKWRDVIDLYDITGEPLFIFFFFNDTATTEIYTLSLHDALPI